jgi:NAD(P)-dependent dehydrogenase (short-subunit alcohol dehydrogenase family)
MADHPANSPRRLAVITGAAGGIGRAAARRFAGLGMKVVLADLPGGKLQDAAAEVVQAAGGDASHVCAVGVDVSRLEDLTRLKEEAFDAFGEVAVLMNNAGIGGGLGKPWESYDRWGEVLGVNLWGVINGVHAFTPALIDQAAPSAIINTGSKQGITNPPGDAAYNASKAAIKAITEQLAHQLRSEPGARISAHLLIPGFTFTGITARRLPEKPPAAWTPGQVADRLVAALNAGEFYVLCEDNETTREMDERRIAWSAGDLIENRPALSRWHPDFAEAFARHMAGAKGP